MSSDSVCLRPMSPGISTLNFETDKSRKKARETSLVEMQVQKKTPKQLRPQTMAETESDESFLEYTEAEAESLPRKGADSSSGSQGGK
jgi:hypothetical protein